MTTAVTPALHAPRRTGRAGRSPRGWSARCRRTGSPSAGLDGADQPGAVSGGAQARLDQVRGGGLAGGAGDADDRQVARSGRRRRAAATGPSTARGSATTSAGSPPPAAHSAPAGSVSTATAPAARGVGGELGAVPACAGQGGEEVTGADRVAGMGDAGDRSPPRRRPAAPRRAARRDRRAGGGAQSGTRIAGHGVRPYPFAGADRTAVPVVRPHSPMMSRIAGQRGRPRSWAAWCRSAAPGSGRRVNAIMSREHRRGDLPAVAARGVGEDGDHVAGRVGRRHADERGDVAGGVLAVDAPRWPVPVLPATR